MYQPQLNYDQARLKLDHLHHEARAVSYTHLTLPTSDLV